MMTQELTHSNPASTSRSSAPSIQTTSTTARAGADWSRVLVRPKLYSLPVQCSAPSPRCAPTTPGSRRWGLVLAGGDGVRLRELTEPVWGADRPKQFCPLLGQHTLLEETRHRAERSLCPEQIVYSVTQVHEQHYLPSLVDLLSQRIVQPSNKGTAPAILSGLLHIAQTDPNAIVVILPCDQYYAPESAFTSALESAFETSERRSRSVVLLGVEPTSPEVDYGWIQVGETIHGHTGLANVEGFQEKPPLALAETLFRAGALWNTFVMIGPVRTFLEMARATVPNLLQTLESWATASSPRGEIRIPDAVYDRIISVDFSRSVLSADTDHLLALRLPGVEWSDLGDPYRVLVTLLEKNGDLPSWVKLWSQAGTSEPGAPQSLLLKEYFLKRQRREFVREQFSLNPHFP